MSDSTPENDKLETLQQMLEAEMRGSAEPTKASEKPASPAKAAVEPDSLGSLLGDLLAEAEKEVGRERPGDEAAAGSPSTRTASDRARD